MHASEAGRRLCIDAFSSGNALLRILSRVPRRVTNRPHEHGMRFRRHIIAKTRTIIGVRSWEMPEQCGGAGFRLRKQWGARACVGSGLRTCGVVRPRCIDLVNPRKPACKQQRRGLLSSCDRPRMRLRQAVHAQATPWPVLVPHSAHSCQSRMPVLNRLVPLQHPSKPRLLR